LNLRGTISLLSNDLAAAESLFSEVLELEPDNVPALLNSARVAFAQNDKLLVREHLERVVELDPQQEPAILGLAWLAIDRRDFASARTWLGRALLSANRLHLEGELAAAEGRYGEAADKFKRAFETQPSAALAVKSYVAATRAGRPAPDAELSAWIGQNPRDLLGNLAIGSIALERGDHDAAVARYETVLGIQPNHPVALNNLAFLYGDRDADRALGFAQRAYEAVPNDPRVADTLGWLYVRRGEVDKGLPLLEQATEKLPDQLEVRYHWAVALADAGDSGKALAVFRELLATGESFPGKDDVEARVVRLSNN
jgi:tetratricopeptide (TPR) repeat protein